METERREKILNNISALVEGTTDLDRILYSLRDKFLLSDYMVNKIKGYETDTKRKEEMYKLIVKRGPTAFNELYETLWTEGFPELAKLLRERETSGANFYTDGCAQSSQERDDVSVIVGRRRMDNDKNKVYRVGSKPKGYMLLINFNKYNDRLFDDRMSGKNDAVLLKKLWEGLGYKVEVVSDLDEKSFLEVVDKFRNKSNLRKVDSAVLYIMSSVERKEGYENEDCIYTKDKVRIETGQIIKMFDAKNCDSLKKKPKLFFFQCFGCKRNSNCLQKPKISTDNRPTYVDQSRTYPNMADILITSYFFLDEPYLNQQNETCFTKAMCDVFASNAFQSDIVTMLEEISRKLRLVHHEYDGAPTLRWDQSGFDRKFYFNPGLYD